MESEMRLAVGDEVIASIQAFAKAIENKDRYTGGHIKRVAHYSVRIARELGLSPDRIERIRLAALLHDVGKIGIDDRILKKTSPLDEAEWEVMRMHPEIGFEMLSRESVWEDLVDGMRYHHERWDGRGYPLGLAGEEIPLSARIIAVADTYDAIVSTRPYRRGSEPRLAISEIQRGAGAQFDPSIVDAFLRAFPLPG